MAFLIADHSLFLETLSHLPLPSYSLGFSSKSPSQIFFLPDFLTLRSVGSPLLSLYNAPLGEVTILLALNSMSDEEAKIYISSPVLLSELFVSSCLLDIPSQMFHRNLQLSYKLNT